MKLIRDRHGRLGILGNRTAEPEQWWKDIQSIPCTSNPNWFSAYPLDGGAVNVQEGTFEVLREATDDEIDHHFRKCIKGGSRLFNPASDTVLCLWEAEKALTKKAKRGKMATSTDDKEPKMDKRKKAKLIRKVVREAGYDYWCTYNDKNKDHQRLKCMQNGFDHGAVNYAKWEKEINKKLKEAGVEVISSGFECLERPGYGDYMAYVARFK